MSLIISIELFTIRVILFNFILENDFPKEIRIDGVFLLLIIDCGLSINNALYSLVGLNDVLDIGHLLINHLHASGAFD
jgi:hypothetical protein